MYSADYGFLVKVSCGRKTRPQLRSAPNLWSGLPYVWLHSAISPFLGHFDGLNLHTRGLTLSSTTRRAHNWSYIHVKLSSHPLTAFQVDAASIFLSDSQLSSKSWSPATRFLGRHGNLKLPSGNKGRVRHENNLKESNKQQFGPQCGPATDKWQELAGTSFMYLLCRVLSTWVFNMASIVWKDRYDTFSFNLFSPLLKHKTHNTELDWGLFFFCLVYTVCTQQPTICWCHCYNMSILSLRLTGMHANFPEIKKGWTIGLMPFTSTTSPLSTMWPIK